MASDAGGEKFVIDLSPDNDVWEERPVFSLLNGQVSNARIGGYRNLNTEIERLVQEYGQQYFPQKLSRPCELPQIDPSLIALCIALEKMQASRTAGYLVRKEIIPETAGGKVPVVCSPDGGISTVEGFVDGLWANSQLDYEIFSSLTEDAIKLARESGLLIFCDERYYTGNKAKMLKPLSERIGKDTPIKVVCYFNEVMGDGRGTVYAISALRAMVAPHELHFVASRMCTTKTAMHRADMIAQAAASYSEELRDYLAKFLKPVEHHVGQYRSPAVIPELPRLNDIGVRAAPDSGADDAEGLSRKLQLLAEKSRQATNTVKQKE